MSNEFEFEVDIPIKGIGVRGRPSVYPFKRMAVGDSVFIARNVRTVASAVYYVNTHSEDGKKFVWRSAIKDEVKGARVWRMK